MPNFYTPDSNAIVTGTLASAVAHNGTFTVAYPSGFVQADFLTGLAGSASIQINDNDRWAAANSRMSVTFNAGDITVTNLSNTSWAAGSSFRLNLDIQDGDDIVHVTLPLPGFAAIANGDVITDFQPGVNGFIENMQLVVTTAVTTASRAATLNLEIGTTDLTGGTIAMTSANMTPLGRVLSSTAITGNNRITKASRISLEASSVTAFAEGAGYVVLRIRKI